MNAITMKFRSAAIRSIVKVASIVCTAACAASAPAATVFFDLDLSVDNQFKVFLSSSAGDNGGIAGYGVVLAGPILSLNHVSPKSFGASGPGGLGPAGFTIARSTDGNKAVAGLLDTFTPTPNLIYGLGQEASSFAAKGITNFDPNAEGTSWDAKLLIAEGTYNRSLGTVKFDMQNNDTFANVFDNPTGAEVIAAMEVPPICPGFDCGTVNPPEIEVTGNNLPISDGDTTPSLLDLTDFGIIALNSSQTRIFNIRNLGDLTLQLASARVAGPFSIVGGFPTNINGSLSQSFQIALNTSTPGTYKSTLRFINNDSNEFSYNFDLSAQVVPEPSVLTILIVSLACSAWQRRVIRAAD